MTTWVLERDVFPDRDVALADAVIEAGGRVVDWSDDWWRTERWPRLAGQHVVFHGSLANADRVVRELPWSPGGYGATDAFACSAWWPSVAGDLVSSRHVVTTVADLVEHGPPAALGDRVFVRPDSPLKPFSGRVLARGEISLAALDHGFYYDDELLPVVVAAAVDVAEEWRFVVVDAVVVAGSAYAADGRAAGEPVRPDHPAWARAQELAPRLRPDPAYVLDVARTAQGLRLLELNPLSGADLYACDRPAVVRAVEALGRLAGDHPTGVVRRNR